MSVAMAITQIVVASSKTAVALIQKSSPHKVSSPDQNSSLKTTSLPLRFPGESWLPPCS